MVTLPDRVTGVPEACAGKSGQEALARLFAPALHERPCFLACPRSFPHSIAAHGMTETSGQGAKSLPVLELILAKGPGLQSCLLQN